MTLNTNIYILDPVDPQEVFNFCNKALLKASNPRFKHEPDTWEEDPEIMDLSNEGGQGFPAWLCTKYRKGGMPLYAEDHYDSWGDGEDPYLASPACFMALDFDTAYGYRDEYGGCSDLHGRYIVALYNWLKEKSVRIKWMNEYTGDIYEGIDGLDTLFKGGDEANEWFRNTVIPAIEANFNLSVDKKD